MRAMLLVLALVLCAAGGLFGFWFLGRAQSPMHRQPHAGAPARPEAELATLADLRRLERQVASMRDELARLSAELGSLRASAGREAVAARDSLEPESASLAISAEQRAAVLQILEEDRDAREQERARQRKQREERVLAARAQRIAAELGLGPADETRLAGIFALESEKRNQIFERVSAEGWNRELVRDGMTELRSWREAEYQRAFGADVAERILELGESEGFERGAGRSFGGQDPEQRTGGGRRGS